MYHTGGRKNDIFAEGIALLSASCCDSQVLVLIWLHEHL